MHLVLVINPQNLQEEPIHNACVTTARRLTVQSTDAHISLWLFIKIHVVNVMMLAVCFCVCVFFYVCGKDRKQ